MEIKDKKYTYGAVGLIVILVLGLAVWQNKKQDSRTLENISKNQEQQANTTPEPTKAPQESTSTQSTTKSGSASALTLEQAIKKYPNRLIFNNCRGSTGRQSSGSLVVKLNTQWLLQNSDEKSHKYAVGAQSFSLKPYGFVVVTAKQIGDFPVYCDNFPGAELTVQK